MDSSEKRRILVMDDEMVVRKVVCLMLERLGYEVKGVEEGSKAIDAYREAFEKNRPYHAVIVDLTVPSGMGGKDATDGILNIDPNAKVVVSTGYANDTLVLHHRRYGFAGVAVKPFRIEDLSGILNQILGC